MPHGRSDLADQLQKPPQSVVRNIAEGAGEYSGYEKARFYRMAKRAATESAAILDVCRKIRPIEAARFAAARDLLMRVVSMLVPMIRRIGDSGTGAGTK